MKRRTKKVLSLLLAASMVFTMNTIAFGEEIVAEDVAADDVAVETVVEGAADADLADAEVADAELAAVVEYVDGIAIDENGKAVTTIDFNSDGAKKNAVNNVAVITNATDPVSWNNYYAANFIETVINGSDKEDDYLNNSQKQHVSENNPQAVLPDLPHLSTADLDYQYGSIPVGDDAYILYKYGTGDSEYVAGFDGFETKAGDNYDLPAIEFAGALTDLNAAATLDPATQKYVYPGNTGELVSRIGTLPVTTWDGRKIAWDKDNSYDATKSMKEDLTVQAALVKYENGTVTEFNGVTVGGVKIDTKAIKQASVEYATSKAKVATKYRNTVTDKDQDVAVYVDEHATMGTLPTFTMTLKVKDKEAKKYNKDIKSALKDTKFTFGILQQGITVGDPTNDYDDDKVARFRNEYTNNTDFRHWVPGELDDEALIGYATKANSSVGTPSSNDITNDKGTGIQDLLAEDFEKGSFYDVEAESHTVDGLKVSKFSAKKDKPKATITEEVRLWKKGTATTTADVTLKVKKDYNFDSFTLAGESVFALTFPEGGNYVYADTDPAKLTGDLSAFGYSYAFRPSPDEKSKKFRYGIVANNDQGFVYNAQ